MKKISAADLKSMMDAGDTDVVDVRDPDEWGRGHIEGARLVPLPTLKADIAGAKLGKKVVFICAKGPRSLAAAELADARGIDASYVDGGMIAWDAAGFAGSANAEECGVPEQGLDAVVGENLKTQRTQRGLSLDELARKSGVSRTVLGQIELGKNVPSIGLVWKIAQALGVPFSTLLSTHQKFGTTILKKARAKTLLSADGRFSSRALFPLDDQRTVEFYELWLAPHAKDDADPHPPGTRENLIVVSGKLEMHIGSEVHVLEEGDAIVFAADVAHSYVNLANVDCKMYLVMTYAAPVSIGPVA
jgi:rhodanese-related sulfurtransferase/transcriptional regulator with XRE-family HTH domain